MQILADLQQFTSASAGRKREKLIAETNAKNRHFPSVDEAAQALNKLCAHRWIAGAV